MSPRRRALAAAATLAALASCIPSNVVARDDRAVATPLAELHFEPANGAQLQGLWASVAITGDAAVALRRVYYVFQTNGTYTAAALVDEGGTLAFQTLSGTFAADAAGLVLDGAEPVQLEQAPEHLRITAPTGTLVLRRETTQ